MAEGVEELPCEFRGVLPGRPFGHVGFREGKCIAPVVRGRSGSVRNVTGERRKVDLTRMCEDRIDHCPDVRHVEARKVRDTRHTRGPRRARRERGEDAREAPARGGGTGSGRRTLGDGVTKGGANGLFAKKFA